MNIFSSSEKITIAQLGAPSRVAKASTKTGTIAKKSLSRSEEAAFLATMVNYLQPKTVVEIGTSFGITTCYLAKYCSENSSIITLEGNSKIAEVASENFIRLGFKNIQLIKGNFEQTIPEALSHLPMVDFVFFDGNHRYEPTMRYFEWCLAKSSEQSTFVFHDIYWSSEMARAWDEIRQHPAVFLSVDLYYFGIIFFRTNQPKQHFILKF